MDSKKLHILVDSDVDQSLNKFFLCNSLLKPLTNCSGLKTSSWYLKLSITYRRRERLIIYEVDLKKFSDVAVSAPQKNWPHSCLFQDLHILSCKEIEWRDHHLNMTCRAKRRHPKGKCFPHFRACNNDDVSVVF